MVSIQRATGTKWNPVSLCMRPDHFQNFGHQCVFVKILKRVWNVNWIEVAQDIVQLWHVIRTARKKKLFHETQKLPSSNYQLLTKNELHKINYVTARQSARRWYFSNSGLESTWLRSQLTFSSSLPLTYLPHRTIWSSKVTRACS